MVTPAMATFNSTAQALLKDRQVGRANLIQPSVTSFHSFQRFFQNCTGTAPLARFLGTDLCLQCYHARYIPHFYTSSWHGV